MEYKADDFDTRNTNDQVSGNILVSLKNTALFDVATLDKYGVAIFNSNSDLKQDLVRVIEILNELVRLDSEGGLLFSYQRRRLIPIINKFLSLNYQFEELIRNFDINLARNNRRPDLVEQSTIDESKLASEMQDQQIIALTRTLNDNLPEFYESLISAVNTASSHIYIRSNRSIQELKDIFEKEVKSIEKSKERVEKIVADVGLLPTKQQINSYSEMFEKDSVKFRNASLLWLLGLIACLGSIIWAADMIFEKINTSQTKDINILIILNISRLLILSGLFYALAVCNKNYKSNKHNQIVNKHRANALSSFQAFAASASGDEKIFNAILIEATHTIFGSQSTGYNSKDGTEEINKLLNLFKLMEPKA